MLNVMRKKIIPAILTKRLSDFKKKLNKVKGFSDWLQVDVMDGKFVRNKSVSLRNLRKIKIPLKTEVHLMVQNPEKYFADCQKIKTKRVIWHIEGSKNPAKTFREMEKYKFEKGLALNPSTPVNKIKPYLKLLDAVLLLGVTPGWQGQKFQPKILKKIAEIKKTSKKVGIGVDGGVNSSNIQEIAKAGADNLVVGSYLVGAENARKNFQLLQKALKK